MKTTHLRFILIEIKKAPNKELPSIMSFILITNFLKRVFPKQ